MDQNEPNLDKDPKLDGEPKLTREIVRIDYGKYVVAHDINSNSLAYKFVMKVYNLEDESAIQHWFYCPFCKILMEQNVTIGTTPLVRHVEKSCPNVPEHTRQELNVLREQKAKSSTKAKKNTMPAQVASKSSSHTETPVENTSASNEQTVLPSQPTHKQTSDENTSATMEQSLLASLPPHTDIPVENTSVSNEHNQTLSLSQTPQKQTTAVFKPPTVGEMADALVMANNDFGETIDSATYERLLMGTQPWCV